MSIFDKIYNKTTDAADSNNYKDFLFEVINKMIPIVEFDVEGIIVNANDSFLNMMGYLLSEIKDKHHSIFVEEDYKNTVEYEVFWENLRKGAFQSAEYRRVRKDGETIWIKGKYYPMLGDDGAVCRIIKFATDITDLKKSYLETTKQKIQLQAIVNTTVDGMITIDGKGMVLTFNPACERIFGYKADEVVGDNVKKLMPDPYHSEHDSYLANYQKTGDAKVIGIGREVQGKRKNGEIFPLELSVADASFGDTAMYSGIVRDISERKELEKMKSEFVSVVSHELRTPLTSIMGSLGLISGVMSKNLPAKVNSLIDIARNNCKSLSLLINDLLDIDKIASGKMRFDNKEHSLSLLIDQTAKSVAAYAEKFHINLKNTIDDKELYINVDAERFKQIITNLLSNAIKFSEKNGSVKIYSSVKNHNVRISVEDNGSGIPEEFQSSVFDKFSQANSSDTRTKGGSGLGLHITKKIVEHMHGTIGFDSKSNEGTVFWVEFALSDNKSLSKIKPAQQVDERDVLKLNKKHKVLICEDNADIVTILKMQIEQAGYETDIAYHLSEAQRKIKSNHYSAITLDLLYTMGGSGLKFISHLREDVDTANLPIIVVSIVAEDGKAMMNANAFGHIDWLQKPIEETRLKTALDKAIHGDDNQKNYLSNV